jgi:hypothetical protein
MEPRHRRSQGGSERSGRPLNAQVPGVRRRIPGTREDGPVSSRDAGSRPDPGLTGRAEFAGVDFSAVRIHNDAAARAAAARLGAVAFTRSEDIYIGAGAPEANSPAGRALLVHELAHVAQQQRALDIGVGEIGATDDILEREAAATGGPILRTTAPARVPEVQRQPLRTVSRSEMQSALEDYLRRAQRAQGSKVLQVTPEVRTTLQRLANLASPGVEAGDPERVVRLMGLEAWLAGRLGDNEPTSFASQVMRFVPDPCPREALRILATAAVADEPGRAARARSLVEHSGVGDPSPDVAAVKEQKPPTSSERVEQFVETGRGVSRHGPYPVDLLQVIRIARGLPEALAGSKPRAPEPITLSPAVEQAVEQVAARIPVGAVTPAGEDPGNVDAGEMARSLALQFAELDRQGSDQAVLKLGPNYGTARNLEQILRTIGTIAQQVRAAVPHRGTGVRTLNIVIGNRHVRVLPISGGD